MINYPIPKFRFDVDMDGLTRIGFTEVSGLDIENEVIEYRDGAFAERFKIQQPGLQKCGTVSCKRGMIRGDNEIHEWFEAASDPSHRRTVQVSLLDEMREPVFIWIITNAFVTKIASTDLKADGNEIAIETMEFKGDSISISTP